MVGWKHVLLEGKLRVDIIDGLGNEVMIEYIVAARAFATPHLFSSDAVSYTHLMCICFKILFATISVSAKPMLRTKK